MKQSYRAYASWMKWYGYMFPFNSVGKLATLWFDEVITQVPTANFMSDRAGVFAAKMNWSSDTLGEVRRLWVPVHRYIPDYKFNCFHRPSTEQSLFNTAVEVTIEEEKTEYPLLPEDGAFWSDVAGGSGGLIEAIDVWLDLNAHFRCCYLPHHREHLVLQELFSVAAQRSPFDLFSEVMTHQIPDLKAYTWDEIVELRQHRFFPQFREKMIELHRRLDSGKSGPVQELVDEISRRDMEEMVRLFRPAPRKALVKGVASNIPMPIPINPLSAVLSGQDVKRELDITKKYGWLYFLLDLPRPG